MQLTHEFGRRDNKKRYDRPKKVTLGVQDELSGTVFPITRNTKTFCLSLIRFFAVSPIHSGGGACRVPSPMRCLFTPRTIVEALAVIAKRPLPSRRVLKRVESPSQPSLRFSSLASGTLPNDLVSQTPTPRKLLSPLTSWRGRGTPRR